MIKGVTSEGSVAISQSIAPGTEGKSGDVVTVEFEDETVQIDVGAE